MPKDLLPEDVLHSLEKQKLAPFYLFYGIGEFRLEKVLDKIRNDFIPESARDLNLGIYYGGEADPTEIINRAQTFPFMAQNRLIIVRRIEAFRADQLEMFLPYLDNPSPSTCLIFIASKTDFKKKFFKNCRSSGLAVHFAELKESQIVPWIKRAAKEIGLSIDGQAATYLQQIVGISLRDLYAELVKLQIRYGDTKVSVDHVKELAIHSRIYSIFELMSAISVKNPGEALSVLNQFLEEEDKVAAPLRIIGMLNRQLRLLWRAKMVLDGGGTTREVAEQLHMPPFFASHLVKQSSQWSVEDFHQGLSLLYEADGQLKSGSRAKPVLENLVLTLCR